MDSDELILKYIVPDSYEGLRVDVFLRARLKKISRTRASRIIASGSCFFLSGRAMTPASRLKANEVVCLRRAAREEEDVPCDFKILHEDERILVVEKPAGLPVHPTSRYVRKNLLNLLKAGRGGKLNLCHRIDRETSGIVLLAKDLQGGRFLMKQFAARRVQKSYLALVRGSPDPPHGRIEAALRRDCFSSIHTRMEVAGMNEVVHPGKPAVTRYQTLGVSRRYALVECFPETGRQHQIRVHMAHLGNPILGDKLYSVKESIFVEFIKNGFAGRAASSLVLPRHALHAHYLSFLHPGSGERVEFTSKLPQDMRRVFEDDGGRLND